MIRIENLTVRFDGKTVFDHASFELPDTGIVLLQGVSGIGKTTLLRVLAKTLQPDSGSVMGLEGRTVSFVFQEPRLLEWRTALENVALVSDRETALSLLDRLGLSAESNTPTKNLSGGQKQRVSLARAFAFGSDVVLLDEPFTGLDTENKHIAADLIRTARLAIVVTHEPSDETFLNPQKKIRL
ncbi:MAG: ABC transporter ATP-binding protein [Clostridia bacterium]|jgi:NitT/TauT family transport system ATP-binding protein|nr:ABC transporter ATP-binding protein [Clostridia bacterium]